MRSSIKKEEKKAKYVVLIHHFRKERKLGQVNFRKDFWDCR